MKMAPRAAVAWAPSANGDSAVRGGVGLFYTQIPLGLFSDVLRLDGRHGQRLVVDRPGFFPSVPDTPPGAQNVTATIRTQAPDLTFPSMLVSTISYDRRLAGSLFGSIGYTWRRGANLLRTRNIGVPAEPAAHQWMALILQFESTGRSSAHDINATVSGNIGPYVTVFGSYGWTRALQDTDDLYSVPADSSNLAAEWGVAPCRAIARRLAVRSICRTGFRHLPVRHLDLGTAVQYHDRRRHQPRLGVHRSARARGRRTRRSGCDAVRRLQSHPEAGRGRHPAELRHRPDTIHVRRHRREDVHVLQRTEPLVPATTVLMSVTNLLNRTNYAPFNGVLTSPFFGTANRALNKRRITLSVRYDF